MKLRYKVPLIFILLDLGVYFLVFHSGIILPIVNPSKEEYEHMRYTTSFPRESGQQILWFLIHTPLIIIFSFIFNFFPSLKNIPSEYSEICSLLLGLLQTGLFFYLIGLEIEHIKSKKNKIIVK